MLMNEYTKNPDRSILNNVVPNTDEYSWKHLTCTYRPWVTGFKAFGEVFNDTFLLLSSFIGIYIDCTEDKMILDIVDFYKIYLEDYFGISIDKINFNSRYDMINAVKEAIDNNEPVLVPCDLIELHYNPMYMLEHRYKCMIIKGYDLYRDLFYIIDNIHVDYGSSTILTDFTCYIDEMFQMNKSFSNMMNIEQCIYKLNKFKDNNITYFTALKYLNGLLKKVEVNEISIIHWEKEIITMKKDNNYTRKMDEIIKTMDFKYTFYDLLFKIFRKLSKEEIQIYLYDEIKKINFEWEQVRREVQYNKEIGRSSQGLYKKIEFLEINEKKLMKAISSFIENISEPDCLPEEKIRGFRILNNNLAKINDVVDGVIIVHNKAQKYDTWIMQDNAAQLLIDNVNEGSLEVKIDFSTGIGEDIHAGIIVKLKSGKKYLFGNVRGKQVSIYCPELGENFDLYSRLSYWEVCEADKYFKVEIDSLEIRFICLDRLKNEPQCIYKEPLIEDIQSVGLFSKTWEYLEHKVRFYDINYHFK